MNNPPPPAWFSREQLHPALLAILTAAVIGLCFLLLAPFTAPLTWALVLAIIAWPLHARIRRWVKHPSLAAALSLLLIMVTLLAPLAFVASQIGREALSNVETVKDGLEDGRWRKAIERNARIAPVLEWVEREVRLQDHVTRLSEQVGRRAAQFVSGSFYVVTGWLITLFLLFYFLRDRRQILASLRGYVPMAKSDADRLFHEMRDAIYAIVYGTLMVALLQGFLGGLMFWWLGLPAPLLWGSVMAFLAILPIIGAAIVWIPAALFLLLEGSWEKALVLTAWGGIVVALIDNLIHPILVKNRLQLHTVPVFLAILGGLIIFGSAGIVLGPVLLAMMTFLLDLWRRRMPEQPAAMSRD
jgi:predicted PurR-regulated permease PerM